MLVATFCLVAGSSALLIFTWAPYLSLAFWLFYVVSYFSAPEKTGRWALDWLRSWKGWQQVHSCVLQNGKLLDEHQPGKKLLFLAAPNVTLIPMFWTFGLHGREIFRKLDVAFAVPRVLLMIPLLRDILLLAGAVEDDFDTIRRLLGKGRAVCMCPSGLLGYLLQQQESQSTTKGLSLEMAQECVQSDVIVVPVVFSGETSRYQKPSSTSSLVASVQTYCAKRWQYPFPVLFTLHREFEVTAMVSTPISPRAYATNTDYKGFAKAVHDTWCNLGNTPNHLFRVEDQEV